MRLWPLHPPVASWAPSVAKEWNLWWTVEVFPTETETREIVVEGGDMWLYVNLGSPKFHVFWRWAWWATLVRPLFLCSKLAAITCLVFLDFGVWFLLSLWWLYDPHDTYWATVSLSGLTTWHDLLHGSAPSFLGCCKRQHWKGVSRSNDQSNILFFFPTRFLQATYLGPSYSNPQERWTCVFLTYLLGFCLTRSFLSFFGVQQIQQMSLQERSGLESLHLRKPQKLRPGSHASSAPPAASVARTTASRYPPDPVGFCFLSLAANVHRFELGKRFWNGSGSFRNGNRCRNVLKWKLILLVVGFKVF